MVRRGYRVSYVTSPQFESKVAALGAEVTCCPELELAEVIKSIGLIEADKQNDGEEQHPRQLFDLATGILAKVRPFYQENRPDLLLYDGYALAGQILAREINVPAIKMDVTFAADRKLFHEQIPDEEYRRDALEMGRRIDNFFPNMD
jgi:UDP:flavonoid glycosyltransferase YjiC (YdhE family)